jgi:16S rRNA (cytosine967-C5)-methyltransferase
MSNFIKKPIKDNKFIKYLLKVSIVQLLYLDFPEYSTVHTAVEISKKYKSEKFMNAVLRNICRQKKELLKKTPQTLNIPLWIKKNIKDFLGEKEFLNIATQISREPFLDINIKKESFKERKWGSIFNGKNIFENVVRVKNSSNITKLPFYEDGVWWVQGLSATLPVFLINKIFANKNKDNISILDVGSAPGGKAFQLLDSGFNVKSIEISKRRIEILKSNFERLKFKSEIINCDFLNFDEREKFDCILIDAPCSGSGLMQKKPEILVTEKKIDPLLRKQSSMLRKASKLVKAGGCIIYAVCSVLRNEGEGQILKFINNENNFYLKSIFSDLNALGVTLKSNTFITTPAHLSEKGGMDGFFIACIFKNDKL